MLLNGKRLEQLQEEDLLDLIGEAEDVRQDFKQNAYFPSREILPEERDKIKSELAADICAFANARGGWIICGMKEDGQGRALELVGLGQFNEDDLIKRIRQTADSQIEPRIMGLDFKVIGLQDTSKGKALVIYIPNSLNKPHWVKQPKKFYIRRSRDKVEMELHELREAFNLSETLVERIKAFRHSRIKALISGDSEEIPVTRVGFAHPTIVTHVIPFGFSEFYGSVDLKKVASTPQTPLLSNFVGRSLFNSDGYLLRNPSNSTPNEWDGYIQVFRDGTLESAQTLQWRNDNGRRFTLLIYIEDLCLSLIEASLRIQDHLDVAAPLIISAALINAQGLILSRGNNYLADVQTPCPRNKILPVDIVIENYEENLREVLRPIFDVFWNAGGFSRSLSYDNDGNWTRVIP